MTALLLKDRGWRQGHFTATGDDYWEHERTGTDRHSFSSALACELASETRRADSAEAELRETAGELQKSRTDRDEHARIEGIHERRHAECSRQYLEAWTRLTEATAPLERCDDELITDPSDDPVTLQLDDDLGVFLGRRAPSPPIAAAPEPRYGYPTGRDDLRVDAAPEPSAGRMPTLLDTFVPTQRERWLAEKVNEESARAESAEAQLAAVLSVCVKADNGEHSGDYALYLIRSLLTPTPSPGAGFQALVDKVGDSADAVTVFATSKPPEQRHYALNPDQEDGHDSPSPGAGEPE